MKSKNEERNIIVQLMVKNSISGLPDPVSRLQLWIYNFDCHLPVKDGKIETIIFEKKPLNWIQTFWSKEAFV